MHFVPDKKKAGRIVRPAPKTWVTNKKLLLAVTLVELVNASGCRDHFQAVVIERMVFRINLSLINTILYLHGASGYDFGAITHNNGELFIIRVYSFFHNNLFVAIRYL
jgi:hypothetical protein